MPGLGSHDGTRYLDGGHATGTHRSRLSEKTWAGALLAQGAREGLVVVQGWVWSRARRLLPGGTHPVKALGLEEVAVGAVQLPPSSGSTAVDGFWKEQEKSVKKWPWGCKPSSTTWGAVAAELRCQHPRSCSTLPGGETVPQTTHKDGCLQGIRLWGHWGLCTPHGLPVHSLPSGCENQVPFHVGTGSMGAKGSPDLYAQLSGEGPWLPGSPRSARGRRPASTAPLPQLPFKNKPRGRNKAKPTAHLCWVESHQKHHVPNLHQTCVEAAAHETRRATRMTRAGGFIPPQKHFQLCSFPTLWKYVKTKYLGYNGKLCAFTELGSEGDFHESQGAARNIQKWKL